MLLAQLGRLSHHEVEDAIVPFFHSKEQTQELQKAIDATERSVELVRGASQGQRDSGFRSLDEMSRRCAGSCLVFGVHVSEDRGQEVGGIFRQEAGSSGVDVAISCDSKGLNRVAIVSVAQRPPAAQTTLSGLSFNANLYRRVSERGNRSQAGV